MPENWPKWPPKSQPLGVRRSRCPWTFADAEQVKAGFRQTIRKIREAGYSGEQRGHHSRWLAVRMKAEDWDAVLPRI